MFVRLEMDGMIKLGTDAGCAATRAQEIPFPPKGVIWKAIGKRALMSLSGAELHPEWVGSQSLWLWGGLFRL